MNANHAARACPSRPGCKLQGLCWCWNSMHRAGPASVCPLVRACTCCAREASTAPASPTPRPQPCNQPTLSCASLTSIISSLTAAPASSSMSSRCFRMLQSSRCCERGQASAAPGRKGGVLCAMCVCVCVCMRVWGGWGVGGGRAYYATRRAQALPSLYHNRPVTDTHMHHRRPSHDPPSPLGKHFPGRHPLAARHPPPIHPHQPTCSLKASSARLSWRPVQRMTSCQCRSRMLLCVRLWKSGSISRKSSMVRRQSL